jgi:predicted alternative tryptophan synthase beta-subunit
MRETKVVLSEKDLPAQWYNLQADLPFPLPPVIHPATKQPIGPDDLAPLFPMEVIKQEVSRDRWVAILAIHVVIDEALRCRERGEGKTIVFVLCGHGHFDLASYERYLSGQLEDFELPQSAIDEALSLLPKVVEPRARMKCRVPGAE